MSSLDDPDQPRNILVAIDADNLRSCEPELLIEGLRQYGRVTHAYAYADFSEPNLQHLAARFSRAGVQPIIVVSKQNRGDNQLVRIPGATDLRLAIDVIELIHTDPSIDAVAIVSGDGDYLPVHQQVKRYKKRTIVISDDRCLSNLLRKSSFVDHVILYHDLVAAARLKSEPSMRDETRLPGKAAYPIAEPVASPSIQVAAMPVADAPRPEPPRIDPGKPSFKAMRDRLSMPAKPKALSAARKPAITSRNPFRLYAAEVLDQLEFTLLAGDYTAPAEVICSIMEAAVEVVRAEPHLHQRKVKERLQHRGKTLVKSYIKNNQVSLSLLVSTLVKHRVLNEEDGHLTVAVKEPQIIEVTPSGAVILGAWAVAASD